MRTKEVKAALARRHPALSEGPGMLILGAWTVTEEYKEIDVLALSCYQHPPGAQTKGHYPRIGYEVKVSRSDYRREVLRPQKRMKARAICHEFYFAVTQGLLKPEEIEYQEPEWKPEDFLRSRCRGGCAAAKILYLDFKERGFRAQDRLAPDALGGWVLCPQCQGKGYTELSRVEREAPTLWIPKDVGLIEVMETGGSRVVRKSPVIKPEPLSDADVGVLARWISVRPDPRHKGVAETQREESRRNREIEREGYTSYHERVQTETEK